MPKYLILALMIGWLALPSHADHADRLKDILQCAVRKEPDRLGTDGDLISVRVMEMTDSFVFVHGALGWHTTWGVLFEVRKDRMAAYETFGAKGDVTGAYGRREVPDALRNALIACDVEWLGLWPYEWPDRSLSTPAPVGPTKPFIDMTIRELLPPQP